MKKFLSSAYTKMISLFAYDKALHFISGLLIYIFAIVIMFCIEFALNIEISNNLTQGIAFVLFTLIGFLKEYYFDAKYGGTLSEKDFLFTWLGGMSGIVIYFLM